MKAGIEKIEVKEDKTIQELIFPRLGARSEKVLVGPQHGVDVGIVEIGNKAVSFTTDPVFIVPEYGWEKAAWFGCEDRKGANCSRGVCRGDMWLFWH